MNCALLVSVQENIYGRGFYSKYLCRALLPIDSVSLLLTVVEADTFDPDLSREHGSMVDSLVKYRASHGSPGVTRSHQLCNSALEALPCQCHALRTRSHSKLSPATYNSTSVSTSRNTPITQSNRSTMVQVLTEMDYSEEVSHSDHLIIRGTEPFNAEPTAAALVEFPITPEDLVYCRNHGPVLDLDDSTYAIEVHGPQGSRAFTVEELRESFPCVEVVAALQVCSIAYASPHGVHASGMQCVGNRRKEMDEKKPVHGILWHDGVVANCRWAGLRLRDLLQTVGVDATALNGWHVCFTSHVTPCQDDKDYGGSIPLADAMDLQGDVLLAYDVSWPLLPCRARRMLTPYARNR